MHRRVQAAFALLVGSLLYLGGRSTDLLMFGWADALGLGSTVAAWRAISGPVLSTWPEFVVLSVPFGLWVYALTVLLRSTAWVTVAPVLAVGAELGQGVGLVPGTFDGIDLIVLLGFVALALAGRVPAPVRHSHLRPALASFGFLVLAVGSSEDPEQKAAREAKEKVELAALTAYMDGLAKIHTKISSIDYATLQNTQCNGEKMKQTAGWTDGSIPLMSVHLPFLARFGADKSEWGKREDYWSFLTDSAYAGHFEDHPDDRKPLYVKDTAERVQETFLAERYFIVITEAASDTAVPPKMFDDHFDSGVFYGWMFIVDQVSGEIECQHVLEVTNSESIDYGGMLDGNDPEKEMHEDFEDNFEDAVEDGIPRGTRLSVGYGSILG
jgi:hypothetical protein